MSEHAKLSPSSSERWMKCPGSIQLSEGIPDEGSLYADEGTFAHEIAAECLTLGAQFATPATAAKQHLRRNLGSRQSECGRFVVDDEMIAAIEMYIDAVFLTLRFAGKRKAKVKLLVEERVTVIPDLVWGTADVLLFIGDELHVFDFKYGSGVWVDVIDNSQLKIYALGALLTFALSHDNDVERTSFTGAVTKVLTHVVQPRHSRPRWRSCRYEVADIVAFNDEIFDATKTALKDDPRFEAGDHCKFCLAKPTCPTLRKTALAEAQAIFKPRTTPPAPTDMTPEMIGKALTVGGMLEEWLHAVRKHAYELADKHRQEIPGWKLVSKGGAHRQWRDAKAAEKTLRKLGVDPILKPEPKLCSPAQAEKLSKEAKTAVETLAYQPDAGTVLVQESDKRKAVKSRVQFQPVEKKDEQ